MLKNLLRSLLRRTAPAVSDPVRPEEGSAALLAEAERARARGDIGAAESAWRSALVRDPRDAESWMRLGTLCYRSGRLAEAHQYFRAVLEIAPADTDALNELGLVELAFGNRTDARSTFELLLDRDPEHAAAWNNLGLALAGQGQLEEAERAFRRALALDPGHAVAAANLGLACRDLNRPEAARAAYARAVEADPASAGIRVGLALALQDLGELDAAWQEVEAALALAPGDAPALCAASALRLRFGDAQGARDFAERALEAAPGDAEALLARAHALLAEGHYREGWRDYDARLHSRASPRRDYALPHWQADEAPAGRLLVYGEQGLGEQIMFASLLEDIAGRPGLTAPLALDCAPRLRQLFRRSFPGLRVLDEEAARHAGTRDFDHCIAIGSLTRYTRNSEADFPRHAGYLRADTHAVAEWRARLPGTPLRVGFAWRGGLPSTGQALRSVGQELFAPVLALPGVRWVSLQHDARPEELASLSVLAPVLHDADTLADIDRSAALVAALDLVIVPCSTMAHLAGALGVPVWVLTPHGAAWRYRLAGETMPWYPSARLFRQGRDESWQEVIARLASELEAFGTAARPA